MSKPFTIAKAISIEAPSAGRVIVGDIDRNRDALWIDGEPIAIAPFSVCFNTGLTDKNGDEIFEGDYIQSPFHGDSELVFFDDSRGAFYTSRVESKTEIYQNGDDEICYCNFPNATIIKRLTNYRAGNSDIIGNLLDAIATPDDTNTEVDSDAPNPADEVDVDPEDITRVDPDSGDDISVDWGQRIDEALGEY